MTGPGNRQIATAGRECQIAGGADGTIETGRWCSNGEARIRRQQSSICYGKSRTGHSRAYPERCSSAAHKLLRTGNYNLPCATRAIERNYRRICCLEGLVSERYVCRHHHGGHTACIICCVE